MVQEIISTGDGIKHLNNLLFAGSGLVYIGFYQNAKINIEAKNKEFIYSLALWG